MRFHEIDSLKPDQLDFIPRERRNEITKLVVGFGAAIVLLLVALLMPHSGGIASYAPALAILIVVILGAYVIIQKQLGLDLLMSNEYQNMLLAQAFAAGAGFGLIVRRDGTIVHASDGMDKIFPSFDYAQAQALDGVFEQGLVRKTDRERIMGAIYSCTSESLVFPIIAPYQETKEYVITVEPMQRPSGFSIVRGREYLGKRAGLQLMPDALSLTSIDKLEHMLGTTTVPHFTTDAFGRIEYANPAFDHTFGYDVGEIIESKLSLHHLIFSMGETLVTEEYTLHDFYGHAELIRKDGGRTKATLQQHLLRDANGKSLGATGTLTITAA